VSTLIQAALLGVVQGLTEFLPVSSSAHLILARLFFGFDADQFGLPFDVAVHIGTLLAVLLYFWSDLWGMVQSLPAIFRPSRPRSGRQPLLDRHIVRRGAEGARLIWLLTVGSIPAVVVGLFFGKAIEERFRSPVIIACTLSIGAIGLFAAERFGAQERNDESLTLGEAFLIGCAQAAALVPGVSSSGATITVAVLLGLRRAEAARFTFLLGIVAIFGAAVLKFPDMLAEGLGGSAAGLFAVGILSSAIVGYLAVKYFIQFLANHSLDLFAWYRLALAAAVVVWLWRN
jgi:undecaprenyl-diphosphatase